MSIGGTGPRGWKERSDTTTIAILVPAQGSPIVGSNRSLMCIVKRLVGSARQATVSRLSLDFELFGDLMPAMSRPKLSDKQHFQARHKDLNVLQLSEGSKVSSARRLKTGSSQLKCDIFSVSTSYGRHVRPCFVHAELQSSARH